MIGSMGRHGILAGLLAAVGGLAGKAFAESKALEVRELPRFGYATHSRRTRIPGKPGRAGDKLRRMAAENRLGVRS